MIYPTTIMVTAKIKKPEVLARPIPTRVFRIAIVSLREVDAASTEETAGGAVLETFSFPEGKEGYVVWDEKAINLAVMEFVEGCKQQGHVLGMDCEWEPPFDGSSEGAVCTLQLALPDGTAYLFHLQRGTRRTRPSTFNRSLKVLLNDPTITKVGVAVKGDGSRLQRDYGVETCGMVDLRSYARTCWVDLPCRSLAGMVATALGKSLSKNPSVRFSRWSQAELTQNQVNYACLDAYAAVVLHAEIGKSKDPIFCMAPSDIPIAGTEVRLYTNNHESCVGVGQVQDEEAARSLVEKWGTDLKLAQREGTRSGGLKRVVVKVVDVLKPASLTPHQDAPPPPPPPPGQPRVAVSMNDVHSGKGFEGFVLWDLVHVRLASDHHPFQGIPVPAASADPDAHVDNFFDEPRPAQAVYQNDGDVESALGGEPDGSSDDDTLDESAAGVGASSVGGADAGGKGAASAAGASGASAASEADASGAGAAPEEPHGVFSVRLDPFHTLNRISRMTKKSHGAFKPFMARLRDACFLVNRDDVYQASLKPFGWIWERSVEMTLEARGMKPEEVQQLTEQNWSFFLRSSRRLVPRRDVLLKRFDRVIEEFGGCVDNTSGEVLLRPKAMKAVRQLRKHIENDCLSDPDGMAMYFAIGKNKHGLTDYRCVRGTNDVEGYHRYLRTLLASYCASPSLAQSVLLEFNYRWNLRMMIKNRGLPAALGGHYNQYLVESIQRDTADWDSSHPVFPEWPAAIDSVDTGERFGLERSLWGGERDGEVWGIADNDAFCTDDGDSDVNGRTPMSDLTLSAKMYAKMMGESMPETRVHTWGRMQLYQRVNFDAWAGKWNADCDQVQQGLAPFAKIYRKTAKQLEEYYGVLQRQANDTLTLLPRRNTANALRADLQQPVDGAAFENSVGQIQPVPVALRTASAAGRSALRGGGEGEASGSVVSAAVRAALAARELALEGQGANGAGGSGSGSVNTGLTVQGGAASGAGDGGSESVAPVTICAKPAAEGMSVEGAAASGAGGSVSGKKRRKPQTCAECGHCSVARAFMKDHPRKTGGCLVSEDRRRPEPERTGRTVRGGRKQFSQCHCNDCKPAFAAFEVSKASNTTSES
ncbi:unnamed protein product [Ectocarpus sp. CCAP 1310/34]|nr:unnamed protein product [Ectocarpus sp. CCAP 1310/34]